MKTRIRRLSHSVAATVLAVALPLFAPAHAQTPIYYCNDPNWIPIDYTDSNGHPHGIAVDMLNYLFRHTLPEYRLLHWKTETWAQSLSAFRKKKCIILAEAVATPKRRSYMLFTQPILEYPLVFVTRRDHPMLHGVQDIGQAVVARQRGSALITLLRQRLPHVRIMEVPDTASAYLAVSSGKADIAIAVAPVAHAMIGQLALDNLIINGKVGMNYAIRIAVHKAYPQLRDRLDAAIVNMPLSERVRIQNFYIDERTTASSASPQPPSTPQDWWRQMTEKPAFIAILLLGALAMLLLFLLARQQHKSRQRELDALTGLPTRHAFDEALSKLMRQASERKPLSLIAIDLDHFKQINDQYGHLQGDRVLRRVAEIMRNNVRENDLIVRWGGEEFFWLCPNTPLKRACSLAERLREQVQLFFREHPELPPTTLSAGVAQLQRGEQADQFIQRADEALYRAKQLGRNRISCARPNRGSNTDSPLTPPV